MLEQNSDDDSDETYIDEEFQSEVFVAADSDSDGSIDSISIDNDLGEYDEWDDEEDSEEYYEEEDIDDNTDHSEQNMENDDNVVSNGEEFLADGSEDSNSTEVLETIVISDVRLNNTVPAVLNVSSHSDMSLHQVGEENRERVSATGPLPQSEASLGVHVLNVNHGPPESSPDHESQQYQTHIITRSSQTNPQEENGQTVEDTNRPESVPVMNSESVETSENNSRKGKRSFEDSFNGSDDGMTCSICMDSYTNAGLHRLTSLSCGHLFGQSCIERWLTVGCHGSARRCPTCNKKASKRDIRVIYAKKLVAVDTAEVERVKRLLEKAQAEKNRLELDCARMSLNLCMKDDEIKNLRKMLSEMKECRREEKFIMPECGSQTTQNISAMQLIELNKEGGCRVSVFNKELKKLLVSQKSPNPLFPGFGVRKIDAYDFRPGPFFFLHPKAIRDMAVHPEESDILLSVSLDGTAKLLDVSANVIAHTYPGTVPLWSCCWDSGNPNMFLTGSQNGVISQYDRRQTSACVNTWVLQSDHTPVVSLASVPPSVNTVFPHGGFLSCRLTSVCAFQQVDGAYIYQPLPIEGPFMSMCYNEATQQILTSSRPSSRFSTTRHTVNQLATVGCAELCNPIHTFNGSRHAKLMSRSCLMSSPDDYWVVAQNEAEQAIDVWSIGSGKKVYNLSAKELAIDLCPVYVNSEQFLVAVSEKGLAFYKL